MATSLSVVRDVENCSASMPPVAKASNLGVDNLILSGLSKKKHSPGKNSFPAITRWRWPQLRVKHREVRAGWRGWSEF
jgi:hypothetical protein